MMISMLRIAVAALRRPVWAAVWLALCPVVASDGSESPGAYWLKLHGLAPWEWWIDHDGDGFHALAEYSSGTGPFDAASFLQADLIFPEQGAVLRWQGAAGASYQGGGRPISGTGTWSGL